VIADLSPDQRLVLHSQVNLQMEVHEFCSRYGWSAEKFRKVAQRARRRLRALVEEYQAGGRCKRLAADLDALTARAGTDDQMRRARLHVENCQLCARRVAARDRFTRDTAALVPGPVVAGAAAILRRAWISSVIRRLAVAVRLSTADTSSAGAVGLTGGSTLGAVALKAGVAALCVAGAAGSYAICGHDGSTSRAASPQVEHTRQPASRVAALHLGNREFDSSAPAAAAPGARGRNDEQLEQITREFGRHRAVIAQVSAPVPVALATSNQPPEAIRQEVSEFGFER
jgi:hypothetical protein